MTRAAEDTPTFGIVGDGSYKLSVKALGTHFTVDRLRRERHELIAEVAVSCDLKGAHSIDGCISVADLNLSSAQARSTRAKLLRARSEAPDVDWEGYVEELCVRTITAERAGSPSQPLHLYPPSAGDAVLDVNGWPWLRDHAMITFADGGGLKSYLALWGAGLLAQSGLTIGYADWELSGHNHRDRLDRLFGDDLPTIHYFRCDRPLIDEADRIRREVRKLSIDYLIFDSAGFATAGPPEAAEHALAYFRAVRQIGVGSHHLAHVNRSETGDQKPFGSTYWHNSARSTWFVRPAITSTDGHQLTVALFNRKSNLMRIHPTVGFQFEFTDTRTSVTRVNVAEVEEIAPELALWQRIEHLLKTNGGTPLAVDYLAQTLDAKPDSIKKAANRKSTLTLLLNQNGIAKIALAERRYSTPHA